MDAIVIGAGAAGLTAAETLSSKGLSVEVIEARGRAGGRIHTVGSESAGPPIELGAEFIHGRRNEVWDIVRDGALRTVEVPDHHWRLREQEWVEEDDFWSRLTEAMATINRSGPDRNVREFLERNERLNESTRKLALMFVEGFHAAPAERMSIQALARANAASERDEGQYAFRIQNGYSALIEWWLARLQAHQVAVRLNHVVTRIQWERGTVAIEAQTPSGKQVFQAGRAIITLPLGVLQSREHGGVVFEPGLRGKEEAIRGLGMGQAARITLQFRSRFWPPDKAGFFHGTDERLPTWWSDTRGPILTGWVGGPRAQWLRNQSKEAVTAATVRTLAGLFKTDAGRIRDLLVASYHHEWGSDPFARGAYSFTPVGCIEMPRRLGEPVADTLFFGGEATDDRGEQGTVHAAIASGRRAAHELIERS